MLTSHLLVKVRFLNSNWLRTFEGSKKVDFGWSWACFKATEVSYNFLKNILLQKIHEFFVIPKIPFEGQNCQKWTSSKMIPKWLYILSFQTPSKLSQNHQNFKVWSFKLRIHQGFKKCDFLFWCKMTILPLVSFLHNFCPLSIFNTFLHAWILQTCPNPCFQAP